MPVILVLGILILIAVWSVNIYNNIIRLRNHRQNSFADIDVLLRQRHDLIPQLVETVKGYAGHEKTVLTQVTAARTAAMSAGSIDDKIKAEQELSAALKGLRVQVEAYPDLKANQNFLQLQEKLGDIEDRLAGTRRDFNSATTALNNAVESFPGNLIASNFGIHREVFFDLGTDARKQMEEPPKVQF